MTELKMLAVNGIPMLYENFIIRNFNLESSPPSPLQFNDNYEYAKHFASI